MTAIKAYPDGPVKAQPDREARVAVVDIDRCAVAVRQLEALPDVAHGHPVAVLYTRLVGGDRVRHRDRQVIAVVLPRDRDFAAVGQQLDAVIDRVFQERLYRQTRYQRAHGQIVDVPAHLQPFAQAQFLDALVDRRYLEFLLERCAVLRAAEIRAQQVGQILDRFLGLTRIRTCQRRDRVHAVEQKVRPDQRL